MQLKSIAEQTVVLVGASTGIGRLTARRFARRGAKVVVAARSEPDLQSLAEEIRLEGGQVLAFPADAADPRQMQELAERAVAEFGQLDTWVHLAGVAIYGRFDELTPEEWKQVIDINLNGQAYGAMAALPHLKRSGRGALIHIASVLGERAVPLQSAYCASKHGIVGMLDSLRVELMQSNTPISVTSIRPASINSTFFARARTKMGVKPAPYPPAYDPGLVADAILYAAAHPTRDMFIGDVARALPLIHNLSPQLVDQVLNLTGVSLQQSSQPKAVDDPNSVFGPIPGSGHARGEYGQRVVPALLYPWLEMQPQAAVQFGANVLANVADFVAAVLRGPQRRGETNVRVRAYDRPRVLEYHGEMGD